MSSNDTTDIIVIGFLAVGLFICGVLAFKYITKTSFVEFTRDEHGRIINIVEKKV